MRGSRAVAQGSTFYIMMTWRRRWGIKRLKASPMCFVFILASSQMLSVVVIKQLVYKSLSLIVWLLNKIKKHKLHGLSVARLVALGVCRWLVSDNHVSIFYQPRPFHHVRAGLPLPEIGYEEDESLLNAVWKKTDHLLEVKTFNYFVKTKSAARWLMTETKTCTVYQLQH